MTVADTILLAYIALGTAGLILGPVAMTARKLTGLHTKAGDLVAALVSETESVIRRVSDASFPLPG